MTALAIFVLVGLTSLVAYGLGRRLGLGALELARSWSRALEVLGLGTVFLLVNLVLGAGIILGFRALTGRFVGVYLLNDIVLVVLSLLQGLVFAGWRNGRK